jgi:hypothetical protein
MEEITLTDISSGINILIRKPKVTKLYSKYPMYCIANSHFSITLHSSREAFEISKSIKKKVYEILSPPQFKNCFVIPSINLNI